MLELITLGAVDLRAPHTHAPRVRRLVEQPKAFAVLVYLASHTAFVRRDVLAAMFWPDLDDGHARNSLGKTLRRITDGIGQGVLEARGWDVGVPEAQVWCDARELERAAAARLDAEVLELFRGEFLDGWHLPGLSEFSHWIDARRLHLRQLAVRAARRVAAAQTVSGDLEQAIDTLRRARAIDPASEVVLRELMALLDQQSDTAAALNLFEDASAWLAREIGAAPSAATRALADAIRGRTSTAPRTSRLSATATAPSAAATAGRGAAPAERSPAAVQPAAKAAAHEAYLKGRYFSAMLPDLPKAIACFEEAVALEPGCAPAWAGLAMAYANLALFAYAPPVDALPEISRAASAALAADAQSGEAHMARGLLRLLDDWDWSGTAADFDDAVALSPEAIEPRVYRALFLSAMGDHERARDDARRAAALDPLGPGTRFVGALCQYKARRHDESIAALEATLELYPHFVLALPLLAANQALAGRPREAVEAARRALTCMPEDQQAVAYAAASLGIAGERADAQQAFARLLDFERSRYVDPWAIAVACCGLGEIDTALVWLRRLRERRSPSAFCVKTEPMFAVLGDRPGYQTIVRRLAFPGASLLP